MDEPKPVWNRISNLLYKLVIIWQVYSKVLLIFNPFQANFRLSFSASLKSAILPTEYLLMYEK